MKKYTVKSLREVSEDIAELMSFYADLVDNRSAQRFLDEIVLTLEKLAYLPTSHTMWENQPNVRRINMENHKVAIIYLIDDNKLEVIAIRAFHTLANPKAINKIIEKRLQTK